MKQLKDIDKETIEEIYKLKQTIERLHKEREVLLDNMREKIQELDNMREKIQENEIQFKRIFDNIKLDFNKLIELHGFVIYLRGSYCQEDVHIIKKS